MWGDPLLDHMYSISILNTHKDSQMALNSGNNRYGSTASMDCGSGNALHQTHSDPLGPSVVVLDRVCLCVCDRNKSAANLREYGQ